MEEEQAFKRSRNTDEMVELRILLQSKVQIQLFEFWIFKFFSLKLQYFLLSPNLNPRNTFRTFHIE